MTSLLSMATKSPVKRKTSSNHQQVGTGRKIVLLNTLVYTCGRFTFTSTRVVGCHTVACWQRPSCSHLLYLYKTASI